MGSALRELARYVEACEAGDRQVTSVCFAECVEPARDDAVTADVEVALATSASADGDGVSLRPSGVDADGRLRFALDSGGSVVPAADDPVVVDPSDASVTSDGSVAVTLSVSVPVETDTRMADATGRDPAVDRNGDGDETADATRGDRGREERAGGSDTSASTTGRDRDVPPFRDRELLAEIYESCGTFAEMADRLEMDVTAETVRRYMIDYDIHQPTSYDTGDAESSEAGEGAAGDAESSEAGEGVVGTDGPVEAEGAVEADAALDAHEETPVVISDGIGLPDDVTVDRLIDTVKRSNTIYEVTQDIGVERQDALEMLQELNLLDLVVGRLATEADRDISREEVVERLREASATG